MAFKTMFQANSKANVQPTSVGRPTTPCTSCLKNGSVRGLAARRQSFRARASPFVSGQNLINRNAVRGVARVGMGVECMAQKEQLSVAVTGATGLIGSRLVARLASQGHKVKVLTRNVNNAKAKLPYRGLTFHGQREWASAIRGCNGVVNLAGEPIATRWSSEIMEEIKSSRINTTKRIADAINACSPDVRPRVLVNASAVGFYGTSLSASMNETSPSGSDYLAEICREWEAAAKSAKCVRVVVLRTGIVLAKEGGALGKMLPVFQIFAGGPLGTGQQWMSWIHRDDVIGLILESLSNSNFNGVYNATAPNPVRMGELCNEIGKLMGRPSWLAVPEFALRTLLGDGAMLVAEGQRVLPSRTQEAGYQFKFPNVHNALRNILMT